MNDAARLDPKAVRERLLARRDALTADAETREQAAGTVELDQQRNGRLTRMDAMQAQAMARAGRERARREMQRIDTALRRLESGEYGDCLRCGEAIAPRRLIADPAATLCIDCAEAADRL